MREHFLLLEAALDVEAISQAVEEAEAAGCFEGRSILVDLKRKVATRFFVPCYGLLICNSGEATGSVAGRYRPFWKPCERHLLLDAGSAERQARVCQERRRR